MLTNELIAKSRPMRSAMRNRAYFLGGIATDHATSRRIDGFSDAIRSGSGDLRPGQIDACGYEPDLAEAHAAALYKRLKGLPRALFVNSTIALEGVVRFLKTLPHGELEHCTFGCYDWDPFAAMLSFPLMMVRQQRRRTSAEQAFAVLDGAEQESPQIIEIRPILVFG